MYQEKVASSKSRSRVSDRNAKSVECNEVFLLTLHGFTLSPPTCNR